MAEILKAQSNAEFSAENATNTSKKYRSVSLMMSVGTKLFLIIFFSIVACVLTVGLMAYSQTKSLIEAKVSDASIQTVSQVANNLDVIFKTYEDLSLQFIIDKDFQQLVKARMDSRDDYTKFETSRKISDKMQTYVIGNNAVQGIMLMPQAAGLDIVTTGTASPSYAEKIKETDWYQEIIESNGRTLWIFPQSEGITGQTQTTTIGLGRLIKDSNTGTASFVLLLELKLDMISESYRDVVLSENNEFSIIDQNGNYVLAQDAKLIGTPAKIALPTEGETASSGATKLRTSDGIEVLAVYKKFSSMDWKLAGTLPVEELVKDAKVISQLTWNTVFIAGLIAIAIGLIVILMIARPLMKLRNLMMEGARGNLTVRASVKKRRDEIGQLGQSFNEMMKQITELALQTTRSASDVLLTAGDLSEASRKTSISAKEIAVATDEIANGAASLAVEAERGSDLTSHMNSQMEKVIEANREMVNSASEVEKASGQGTSYMGVLIEKTGLTEEMTRSMVEKVDALKESTGSIVKILDVLNSLTKQTNILSLNASIEAARAGAAGKGFMVVADEIRKLADQSRQSIDVVGQITQKIQGEIDETVQVLSDAYPLFQEQIESVKEANQIFLSVQSQMGQFTVNLDLATASISQLNESQTVLSDAMGNVSAVAEEASATSEEVASLSSEQLSVSEGLVQLSEKLDAVSRGLKDSLSKFRIE